MFEDRELKTMARPYRGVWPVVPTIFTETGDLDLEGQKRVLDCMVDQGSDGLSILANYSEQFLLSDEERDVLARVCIEHVAGRVPIVVAASHFSTRIVVDRCRKAAALGASMVMLMPPYHGAALRGTEGQTREQFARAADAGLPIMVQDAPLSGVDLSVPFLAGLAREVDGVSYFKIETPQAAAKLRNLIRAGGEAIEGPFDGEEAITLLADLDAGATGTMPSALVPDLLGPIVTAHSEGRRDEAVAAYGRVLPLINYENRQCGLRACKSVMREGGVIQSDHVRAPLGPLAPEVRSGLMELVRPLDPVAARWGL